MKYLSLLLIVVDSYCRVLK